MICKSTNRSKVEIEQQELVPSIKKIPKPKTPRSVTKKTPGSIVKKTPQPRTPRSVTKKIKSEPDVTAEDPSEDKPAVANEDSFNDEPTVDNESSSKGESIVADEKALLARPKRKRGPKVEKVADDDWDVLPHGMGKNNNLDNAGKVDFEEPKPKKRRSPTKKVASDTPKTVRVKKAPYGLTPGISPFPDHVGPTAEACEEVHRLLKIAHDPMDKVKPPKEIPPPSMDVTGCGEVPDLLDAMLRTMLSAATSNANSNRSIKGLGAKFGLRTVGLGAGSIDWDAVHAAPVKDLFEAIKSGGLADRKAGHIKQVLDIVYKSNLEIRDALLKEKETGESITEGLAERYDTQEQKDAQLARFEETLLCMDYIFELSSEEAMTELTKLPGIGVKTASCVILFNMQRPSFAVDTHVWRLCKWLGWVPEKASRDQTFSHGEVHVPDHLKYALHQLFIKHGQQCKRCSLKNGTNSEEFINAVCPLEHLIKRTERKKDGKRAAGSPVKKGAKSKKAPKNRVEEEESEVEDTPEEVQESADEESELSELEEEGEADE